MYATPIKKLIIKKTDVILNRAKDYYKHDKEKLREQARDKYRNLSDDEKENEKRKYRRDRYPMSEERKQRQRISKKLLCG